MLREGTDMEKGKESLFEKVQKTLAGLGKKKLLAVYGGLFVLLLGLYAWENHGEAKKTNGAAEQIQSKGLEERLSEVLGDIRGAGQVRVLITYETGEEKVTATVSTTDESISGGEGASSSQKRETVQPATVTTEEGQQAIVLYEKEPRIRGVLVVAEGAGDPFVRLNLQRAVMAVTGVSLDRIEVFEMGYGS